MQLTEKKYWKDGLNGDDSDLTMPPAAYCNMKNFRFGSTSNTYGATDILESIGSTVLKANANLVVGDVKPIRLGSCADPKSVRIIYFVWNPGGNDAIYCYDVQADIVYAVLKSSQLTGGLNFDKYHCIHSCYVLNGCVYWTDNLNEPRRLNIDAGIKLNHPAYVTDQAPYTAPLDISIISWIRRQPGIPVTSQKLQDMTTPLNYIKNEAFQFFYRYTYRDYEIGTLSGASLLQDYNLDSDDSNYIDITFPLAETIQQDVIQIDLVAKYFNGNAYFIINTWRSVVPADAAAIAAHNAGTAALTYNFYNITLGVALDPSYSVKPYDSVPRYAQTVEAAKNRSFMGNYTIGYDTPLQTSLSYTLNTLQPSTDSVLTHWQEVTIYYQSKTNPSDTQHIIVYVLQISSVPGLNGYYSQGDPHSPPLSNPTIPFSQLTFQGADETALCASFQPVGYYPGNIEFLRPGNDVTVLLNTPVSGAQVFKGGGKYFLSIEFLDYYGRKCGYLTGSSLKVTVPYRTYSGSGFTSSISWLLSNVNALVEIPDWAYYYSVNITKCLTTRFFLQATAYDAKYATFDSDHNYVFTETNYDPNAAGVAIDITSLNSFGMGYVFSEGDQVVLYESNGNQFILSATGQSGNWLICQLQDVGTLDDPFKHPLFEIYTPYQASQTEPSFEVAQIIPVQDPTLATRRYSVTSGNIRGDIYLLNRRGGSLPNYVSEAMSPNDKYYKNWNTDAGRPNFVDYIGEVTKVDTIAWSNTFINGAKVNGLSTFDALDTKDISAEFGGISKLVLTNKIQLDGSIMLAICAGGETASLYLSENIIQATTGQQIVAQTTDVIGYVNPLRGSYGTNNPESVVKFRGNVYWFDGDSGKYIQYSDNGLFPISNYKMTRYWKLFSDQYNVMTPQQIEALGSRPFVFSGIDPHNEELLVSVPRVLADPPKGYFNDYAPPIPFPFDVWDGQAKSIVYKINTSPNRYQGSYDITAEGYEWIEDDMYAFKDGNIYKCNDTSTFCNFFGTQYQPAAMPIFNENPMKPKTGKALSIQANVPPSLALFRIFHNGYELNDVITIQPFQQGTDLLSVDFTLIKDIFYADLYRDRLTPGYGTNYYDALFGGDSMEGCSMFMMLQFDASAGLVQVREATLNYALSTGHAMA